MSCHHNPSDEVGGMYSWMYMNGSMAGVTVFTRHTQKSITMYIMSWAEESLCLCWLSGSSHFLVYHGFINGSIPVHQLRWQLSCNTSVRCYEDDFISAHTRLARFGLPSCSPIFHPSPSLLPVTGELGAFGAEVLLHRQRANCVGLRRGRLGFVCWGQLVIEQSLSR